MRNNIKIAYGILIFSVLAVVVLAFFLFNQGGLTGYVVENIENENVVQEQVENQVSCSDSDGMNYDNKGSVSYCVNGGCSTERDSCSAKSVTEWYCENKEKKSTRYECKTDCDEGACVNLVVKYKQPNSGGGGGGGGGSSGGGSSTSAIPETYATYDLGELTSEQSIELVKNENVKFKIAGQEYAINLQDKTPVQATISVSTISGLNIALGADNNLDLNNDGVSDLYVMLKSVNSVTGKAKLILYQASYYG